MFYKLGDDWIVKDKKGGKEVARVQTLQEATLIHYEQVEPHLLEDFKAGKLKHKP